MPNYILLMKLTDQGIKTIKDPPSGSKKHQRLRKIGGELTSFYTVMGEYGSVAVGEAPSDEVAMTFGLALGSGGNVRTTSLKGFTKEEFAAMVEKKLP